jgi:putative transposase
MCCLPPECWGGGGNIKKAQRIYNALGLQLRNKTPKRRVKAELPEDRCEATWPNDTGAWTSYTTSW